MALDKINFRYPKGSLQSVYDHEEMTALELAAKTSKKVDECVELVNGVEQSAIEATAVVDEMRTVQEQFIAENNDIRQEIVTQNQTYIDTLTTAKSNFETELNAAIDTFESGLNTSKTTFETNMTNAVNTIITNSESQIQNDVNSKIGGLITDGTIESLINDGILGDLETNLTSTNVYAYEASGIGVISGLQVLPQSSPNMSVLVSAGVAHTYNGKRYIQTVNQNITIDPADALYPRIDIIYINSSNQLVYGKGNAALTPIAPTPTNALVLGQISVQTSTTTITSDLITDKRVNKPTNTIINTKLDRRASEFIHVPDYGADSTGVVDCGSIVQNLINELHVKGGGILYFPKGTYLISINLVMYSDITIRGAGMENTILRFSKNSPPIFGFKAELQKNITIEDITFYCVERSSGGYSIGLYFYKCTNCITRRVKVEHWQTHALRFEGSINCHALNCYAYDCGDPYSIGTDSTRKAFSVGATSGDNVRAKGCSFEFCDAVNCVGGNRANGIGGADADDIKIIGCTTDSCDYGINLQRCNNVQIIGNTCKNSIVAGIDLSNGCKNSIISKNICFNSNDDGIKIWGRPDLGSENLLVENNICFDNGNTTPGCAGIRLDKQSVSYPTKNCIVTNNMCFETRTGTNRKQDYGILETDSNGYNRIEGNNCYNNLVNDEEIVSRLPVNTTEYGQVSTTPPANAAHTLAITFKTPFKTPPYIIAMVQGDTSDSCQYVNVSVRTPTTAGATLVVGTTDATNLNTKFLGSYSVNWMAVGKA